MTTNLIEAIQEECDRVRGLIRYYEEIGPAGAIGAAMLRASIELGERAIAAHDAVAMIQALQALRDCEA